MCIKTILTTARLQAVMFLIGLAVLPAAQAVVIGETIEYKAGGVMLKGYVAYDDRYSGPRPGVLVVHEWWGLNDYARKRADMLAQLGYVAFAIDMYGQGRQADHPEQANQFSSVIARNLPLAKARFMAGLEQLQLHALTDPRQLAAIGYCFGGAVVLQMAREGVDLDAVVSFHGSLGTTNAAQPGMVKARILVAHGADDPFVPAEQLQQFRQEMMRAGANFSVQIYPGAKHSFTNPAADDYGRKFQLPLAYNEQADKASWQDMQQLFSEVFKPADD